MTGDFAAFFQQVRELARKHGIQMHIVCGVVTDGAGGQVRVASHGSCGIEGKGTQFIERCLSTMDDSLTTALGQLSDKVDPPRELMN